MNMASFVKVENSRVVGREEPIECLVLCRESYEIGALFSIPVDGPRLVGGPAILKRLSRIPIPSPIQASAAPENGAVCGPRPASTTGETPVAVMPSYRWLTQTMKPGCRLNR